MSIVKLRFNNCLKFFVTFRQTCNQCCNSKVLPYMDGWHKSIKSSSDKVRCVFFNCLLLNLDFIYAACLEIKKQKEEFKKKQPKQSALYKQCIVLFSFPSCHITAQLYLLGCLFSIAKQKGLRGSVPLVTCVCQIRDLWGRLKMFSHKN